MKALTIFAGIGAIVIAGILAYAATQPDDFSVSRALSIKAPPDKIFPLINDLHAFNTWNPFLAADPATKLTYSGPASGIGAAHEWDGNAQVGQGRVEIIGSQPSSLITLNLDMIKPMAAHNIVNFTLEPNGEATQVTWTMSGKSSFISKVMCLAFDMDKMVGGEFEKGLASLKAIAEKSQ